MATCKERWGYCKQVSPWATTHACFKALHPGKEHRCWYCGAARKSAKKKGKSRA